MESLRHFSDARSTRALDDLGVRLVLVDTETVDAATARRLDECTDYCPALRVPSLLLRGYLRQPLAGGACHPAPSRPR